MSRITQIVFGLLCISTSLLLADIEEYNNLLKSFEKDYLYKSAEVFEKSKKMIDEGNLDPKRELKAYVWLARSGVLSYRHEAVESYIDKALNEKSPSDYQRAMLLLSKSLIYSDLRLDLKTAGKYLKESLTYAEKQTRDPELRYRVLANIAHNKVRMKDYEGVEAIIKTVLENMDKYSDVTKGEVSIAVGLIYNKFKEYEKAGEYSSKAGRTFEGLKLYQFSSAAFYNAAVDMMSARDFGAGLKYYLKSSEMAQRAGDDMGVIYAEYGIMQVTNKMGDHKKAARLGRRVTQAFDKMGHPLYMVQVRVEYGTALIGSERYKEAAAVLNKAIELGEKIPDKSIALRKKSYEHLDKAYMGLGEFKKARDSLHKASELREMEIESEKSQALIDSSAKFDSSIKEQENKILEKENQIKSLEVESIRRSRLLMGGIISLLAIGFVAIGMYFIRNVRLREEIEQSNMILKEFTNLRLREADITKLNSQLEETFKGVSEIFHKRPMLVVVSPLRKHLITHYAQVGVKIEPKDLSKMYLEIMEGELGDETVEKYLPFCTDYIEHSIFHDYQRLSARAGWIRVFIFGKALSKEEIELLDHMAELASSAVRDIIQADDDLHRSRHEPGFPGVYAKSFWPEYSKTFQEQIDINYKAFSVVYCDVNRLKHINDTYGHRVGNEFLQYAASLLTKNSRTSDLVFRVGGDEFVIFCPATITSEVMDIKKRIKAEIAESDFKFRTDDGDEKEELFNISLGVVCSDDLGTFDIKAVKAAADKQMYEDKENWYKDMGIKRRTG